jgi:hypothetical protein
VIEDEWLLCYHPYNLVAENSDEQRELWLIEAEEVGGA